MLRALRTLSPRDLQISPDAAASRLADRYAEALGVDPGELVAGRGPSEALRAIAARAPTARWPSSCRHRPSSSRSSPAGASAARRASRSPPYEQLDAAMDSADLVVMSNPHALTGVVLDPVVLAQIANRHPASTLVVDETDVEFLTEPGRSSFSSLIGTDADNVIVLRSIAEFSGMGSTRTGVAWSRDRYMLRVLFDPRFSAPISGLDVVATEAALASRVWAEAVRRQVAEDGGWLAHALAPLGTVVDGNVAGPFRFLVTDRAEELAAGFARQGVDVLVVGPNEGHPGGLRIAAPRVSERAAFTAAIHGLTADAKVLELGVAG